MKKYTLQDLFGLVGMTVVLAVLVLAASGSSAVAAEKVERIVAVVNGEIITQYQLDEGLKPFLERFKNAQLSEQEKMQLAGVKRKFLDRMIDDLLLKSEVERLKLTVSDAEVEAQIKQIMASTKMTEEQFAHRLELEKMTRKEYEKKVREDILKQKVIAIMVRRKVVVTDEEIEKRYQGRGKAAGRDGKVELGLILLPLGMDASGLREKIRKGELTFEDAAAKYSEGPGANHGGNLGVLALKDLDIRWRQALDGVAPGDLSQPFPVQSYQAILKLKGADGSGSGSGGGAVPAENREELRDAIQKAKFEELFNEYMEKLRAKALIDIKL